MKKNNLKRFLASLLAVLMLSQVTGVAPGVFADFGESSRSGIATQAAKSGEKISLKGDNFSIRIPYNDDGSINFDALYQKLFDECVDVSNSTPQQRSEVTIERKAKLAFHPLQGDATADPIAEDTTYEVKFTYHFGWKNLNSTDATCNVTFLGREASAITFKEKPVVKIAYEEKDGNVEIKFDDLYKAIWNNVVASTDPELSLDDVTIKYHAEAATGSVGEWGKKWVPLSGEKDKLTYPAISEGDQELRFEFKGNADYTGFSKEVTVKFEGRDPAFEIIPGVTQVDMKFKDATNYDYEATANAIREAVVNKLAADESINLSDVTVEYNAAYVGTTFKPLDNKDITTKKLTADEEFTFRLSWGGSKGTAMYKPFSEEVKLTLVDNRAASSIVLKKNASITYNMDAENMKEQIFKNAIDWDSENTKLPAKETLTPDDFVITYYAEAQIKSGTDIGDELLKKLSPYMHKWVGIEGEENTILEVGVIYPQMGAGEQQIRIQYVGNKEYRPSTEAEGNLTVKKADVKVKVHSTSIYPNEVPGDDFVTLNPNDPAIDVYVIYGGVTSNLSGSIYLQLPSTNPNLVNAINKALEYMGKPPLQEGITVGELKAILNEIINFGGENSLMQEAIKLILKQYGIDYGTLKNIINALNKLPSLSDNVRIVIGFPPNHAGLYLAIAVTDNENYNTAIGTGLLTVKMRVAGVKIQLNESVYKKTLTVSEAEAIVANKTPVVTLTYNGSAENIDQSSVHYLYTGVTKPFGLYSSKEFPTKPGSYIVTASVIGGDYLAAPKTFTFKIVAD